MRGRVFTRPRILLNMIRQNTLGRLFVRNADNTETEFAREVAVNWGAADIGGAWANAGAAMEAFADAFRVTTHELQRQLAAIEQGYVSTGSHQKSMELFYSLLTPEQIKTWETNNYIDITTKRNNTYRLFNGLKSFNVVLLNDVKVGSTYTPYKHTNLCSVPADRYLPIYDQYAAQLLLLTTNETWFLRTAYSQALTDEQLERMALYGGLNVDNPGTAAVFGG